MSQYRNDIELDHILNSNIAEIPLPCAINKMAKTNNNKNAEIPSRMEKTNVEEKQIKWLAIDPITQKHTLGSDQKSSSNATQPEPSTTDSKAPAKKHHWNHNCLFLYFVVVVVASTLLTKRQHNIAV